MESKKHEKEISLKAVLWGAIVILLVLVLYSTFFGGSVNAAQSVVEPISQAAKAYSGMVGGC